MGYKTSQKLQKIFGIIAFALLLTLFVTQVVFAVTESSLKTFRLHAGASWRWTDINGDKHKNRKESASKTVSVFAHSKTMWTSPSFRIVNSDNKVRSDSIPIRSTGKYFLSNSNAGEKGYDYYASMKPSSLQTGSDDITFKFNPYQGGRLCYYV